MEWTDFSAERWEKVGPLESKPRMFDAIQPTILIHAGDRVQILCRTRQGVVAEAWSNDGGKTWSPLTAATLPNPNAGIDAIRLADGRFLLVYNHTTSGRSPLNVATSHDGVRWVPSVALENQPGEYSYPAVIQTQDGNVHVTYTWRRERIKHVVLDPTRL
jgi:predicted neuraminidase